MVSTTSSLPLRSSQFYVRGSAAKSLARPGRKEATVTKPGIYSTYSPQNSMYFLVFGVKWLGQEGNHSCLFSAKMNVWTCTSTYPYGVMVWCLINHKYGCTTILYIKCSVNKLSTQWLCFVFSHCAVWLILSLKRSILPPSSGWPNWN